MSVETPKTVAEAIWALSVTAFYLVAIVDAARAYQLANSLREYPVYQDRATAQIHELERTSADEST